MKIYTVGDLLDELAQMQRDTIVFAGGVIVTGIDQVPGFYDGYQYTYVLDADGKPLKMVKNYKDKCRLFTEDIHDVITDYPDVEIEEGYFKPERMAELMEWKKQSKQIEVDFANKNGYFAEKKKEEGK